MTRALAIAVLLCLFTSPASAFTCAQVIWGRANLPTAMINYYIARATPAEIAKGKRCLWRAKPKARKKR